MRSWVSVNRLIMEGEEPIGQCGRGLTLDYNMACANAQLMAMAPDLARALANLVNTIGDDRPEALRARELISTLVMEQLK